MATDVYAQAFGNVVSIHDGDTITVLVDRTQIRIRLTEIDAPELKQSFGIRSRQSLAELCFQKSVTIYEAGKDKYGRTLARVVCDGVDANAEQVRRGMAWVFDRYITDKSMYTLQSEAKSAMRGLWADTKPIPPWEWRSKSIRPIN